MPRVDACDVRRAPLVDLSLGFSRGIEGEYEWGPELGRGGFGTVRLVRRRLDGAEFAFKSVTKALQAANASEAQQRRHLDSIRREVAVLGTLRGTLNVVRLEAVFEDQERVHIVMEVCRGGELWQSIGKKRFSEEMVAKIMRAALRTLAQCHAHRILHRDIKPGNFMFITSDDESPIKAVDFGLAVFYDPADLPRRDLGFDGTPWFMAPEVLSSEVVPASDVWSAGVMAYQLLTGYLPFDDRKNKRGPELSKVWKAILTEEPSFSSKYWQGTSEPAQDFVRSLLQKDPTKRPSAREALRHPWVKKGGAKPTVLSATVVQRIQRFGQSSVLKRTVLDMIASELVHKATNVAEDSAFGSDAEYVSSDESTDSESPVELVQQAMDVLPSSPLGASFPERTWHGGCRMLARSLSLPVSPNHTVHGAGQLADIANQNIELAGHARKLMGRGFRFSHQDLKSLASATPQEWEEKRKVARLALDTSVRNGDAFSKISVDLQSNDLEQLPPNEEDSPPPSPTAYSKVVHNGESSAEDKSESTLQGRASGISVKDLMDEEDEPCQVDEGEVRVRGQSQYKSFVESQGGSLETASGGIRNTSKIENAGVKIPKVLSSTMNEDEIRKVAESLQLTKDGGASEVDVIEGLTRLGYHIAPSEVASLMQSMAPGNRGHLKMSQFLASQFDWQEIQENSRDQWLECARRAFGDLDKDSDGLLKNDDIIDLLRNKLPEAEVDSAVQQASMEMFADEMHMDFEGFVSLIRQDSSDSLNSLDQYDERMGSHHGQVHNFTSSLTPVPEC